MKRHDLNDEPVEHSGEWWDRKIEKAFARAFPKDESPPANSSG